MGHSACGKLSRQVSAAFCSTRGLGFALGGVRVQGLGFRIPGFGFVCKIWGFPLHSLE